MHISHWRQSTRSIRLLLVVLLSTLALNLFQLPLAHAAAITTVTSTADSGPGSLRQAIINATAGDTIVIATSPNQTITLASQLELTKNLIIQGPGANTLTISGNNATRAFQIDPGVSATITQLTIAQGNAHGNALVQTGGGILNKGTLTLQSAVVRDSSSAEGGALQNDGPTSVLTVTASTLVDNASDTGGGGIRNEGTATVTNSTLTSNQAVTSGGGISNSGTITVLFSTITSNQITGSGTGSESGGGITTPQTFTTPGPQTTLKGTIVAGNSSGPTGKGDDIFNSVVTQGYNLIGNDTFSSFGKGVIGPGDQVGTPFAPIDPKLGPLAISVGSTPTLLPQLGSPAIDMGGLTCPTTDQRGLSRPQGAACDVGAVEVQTTFTVNDTDPGIQYNGTWRYSSARPANFNDINNDVHYTQTNADEVVYTFTGTGISYISEKSIGYGHVDVYIDGVFQQTVNANSTTANNLGGQVLYRISGLPTSSHTIKLIKKDGVYMLLDGFTVQTAGHTVNDSDPAIQYSGSGWAYYTGRPTGWNDINNDVHATTANGDSVSYTFTGTSVAYISEKSFGYGNVDVYIDGVFKRTVNANSTAYNQGGQVLYHVSSLPRGSHTIKLVKKDGGYMVFDAFTFQ